MINSRVLYLLVFSSLAQGVEAQSSPEECAEIDDRDRRVDCYDMLFRTQSDVDTSAENWVVTTDVNPIDDSATVTLINEAAEGRSGWGNFPVLVIRCRSNKTELYINWLDFLGSDSVRVTTRVGDNEAETNRWGLSTDSKASFAPGKDISLIKSLMTADRFVAQTTPYNESPVTAVFDISGLEQAIEPLRKACNW